MKKLDSVFKNAKPVDRVLIDRAIKDYDQQRKANRFENENRASLIKSQQDKLLALRLEGEISAQYFKEKNNQLEGEIFDLTTQKNEPNTREWGLKCKTVFELAGRLHKAYKLGSDRLKANVIKHSGFELVVTPDKELQIAENFFIKSSKMLKNLVWYSQGDSNPCFRRERAAS